MPLKQDELKRQLVHAQKALEEWSGILKERGVADEKHRRDPVWRSLNAQRRQLTRRMNTSAEVVALAEELKKRKAEKAQIVTAPEEKKPKTKKKKESQSKKSGTKKKTPAKKKGKKK